MFHEYEASGRVGVAFPRRLLRGRGDRQQKASWAPEAVTSVEKLKNNQQEKPKPDNDWPGDGSSGGYVSDFQSSPKIDH